MRRRLPVFFALVVAAFALIACKHAGSARLEGKWKGTKAEGVAAESQLRANEFATQMELDVKGDSITVKTATDKQTGKYKVLEETKSAVIITTDKDGPDDKQTFLFVDDKTMKWNVMDNKTIVFVKQ